MILRKRIIYKSSQIGNIFVSLHSDWIKWTGYLHYTGPHSDIILLMPDLFDMLSHLLDDGRVHKEARQKVCQAIAYFITPFDLLPEEVYGVEGYIDQCYVALYVLTNLQSQLPDHVVDEAWEGEGTFKEIVSLLPELERQMLPENIQKVHRYLGL